MQGWTMYKDGKPYSHTVEKTKRSLLIGYDMIPLQGLIMCEKQLKAKGIEARKVRVHICQDHEAECYMPTVHGKITVKLASYSNWTMDRNKTLMTTTLFFAYDSDLPKEDRNILNQWYHFPKNDGRRKSTYKRLCDECDNIFYAYGIAVYPVRFEAI